MVKNLPAMQETWVRSLGWKDPWRREWQPHSSILAWRIPTDRGAWWATVHAVAESDMAEKPGTAQHSTCTFLHFYTFRENKETEKECIKTLTVVPAGWSGIERLKQSFLFFILFSRFLAMNTKKLKCFCNQEKVGMGKVKDSGYSFPNYTLVDDHWNISSIRSEKGDHSRVKGIQEVSPVQESQSLYCSTGDGCQ